MNEKNEKQGKYSFCSECENYKTSFDSTKFEKCPLNQKLRECSKKILKTNDGDEMVEKKAIGYYMEILDVKQSQVYKIIRGEYNPYRKLEGDNNKLKEIAKALECSIEDIECPCQKQPELPLIGVLIPNPANYYLWLYEDCEFRKDVMELHDALNEINVFLGDSKIRIYKKLEDIMKVLPDDIVNKLKLNEKCAYSEFKRRYIIMILRSYYKIYIED